MVDRDLLIAKAGSVRKHLKRVEEKRAPDVNAFLQDIDRQEILCFNLQLAIQNCIDIAAHIVGEEGMGVPGSVNEMFYFLEESGYLSHQLTEQMVKAIGFRNLLVHEYGKIDLKQVHEIALDHANDLRKYLVLILEKLEILET